MKNLANFCYSHRRLVLLGWIGLLIGLFALSAALAGEFKTEFKLPGSESQAAVDLLQEKGVSERTGFAGQVVVRADQGVNDPAVKQSLEAFFADIESNVEDVSIASPYDPANGYQIASDGKIAYAEINFSDRSNEQYIEDADEIKELHEEVQAAAPQGLQIELGGDLFAEQPEFSSEVFGLLAAVIILLLVFGSLLAMGLPIATALAGLGAGSALIALTTRVLSVPDFTTQVAAMIGIGVGIDYALLIVTRYRSGLHEGLKPKDALTLSVDTSGRAVVFAGITVVISLLGMFFLNLDFMRSMATGAVLAVLMTMVAAITLLPAILGFVGYNIDRWSVNPVFGYFGGVVAQRGWLGALVFFVTFMWLPRFVTAIARGVLDLIISMPHRAVRVFQVSLGILMGAVRMIVHPFLFFWGPYNEVTVAPVGLKTTQPEDIRKSFWYRWSRLIQARPWPALILSTGVLVVLAIPVFSIRLGFADAGNRLESDTTRKSYEILSEGFGVGFNSPILVVLETPDGPADSAAITELQTELEGTAGVASVSDPIPVANGSLQLFNVFPDSAPQDEATTELVHRLRNQTIAPVVSNQATSALTTGGPAFVVDFSDYMADKLPIFFGAVLLLSFLLLLTVFHSVIVPLKAVIMNMLSIGASFGAMVAVFQWGVAGSLIGVGKEGPIEAWAPMMLFAIVFGLSMDYEVFLLTRVREEYDRTKDNGRAVADGLAATGRVISAAALIMVCVFGSFMLGDERALKLLGFGLAFAVAIDATIVRLVLVPSAMELLGNANWWAPRWLVRILPTIRVDTVEQPVPAPAGGGGGGS